MYSVKNQLGYYITGAAGDAIIEAHKEGKTEVMIGKHLIKIIRVEEYEYNGDKRKEICVLVN